MNSIISPSPSQSDHIEPPLLFMCSYGGEILPRGHNANQLCYIGGDTHILSINRRVTFSSLLIELSDLTGDTEITVKYHLPSEDLDRLISVKRDNDVENMMVAYNQLIRSGLHGSAQLLQLFIFPKNSSNLVSHTNDHHSEHEGYKHEEVQPLVMEQNLTKSEELKQEKLARTAITLEASQSESELKDDDSNVVEPSRKWNTFEIPSAMQNLETLWTWLIDDDVHTIKIEGESGTGKAWMVRRIVDRARASNVFDTVIWSADSIDGKVEWEWEWELRMQQSPDNLQERLSKLVFVGPPSRKFNVDMDRVLEVKELSQIEARLVFENRSGLQLGNSEIRKFAQPLLEKCNGNLSMIIVLAESLRSNLEKSSTTLRAIDILLKASDLLVHRSMPIVEVVCEMLPTKQVRDCFRYFLWYISDRKPKEPVNVRHLITYFIFQGCLDGYNCLADAYTKGKDILLELTDCCLLIRHDNDHVTAQSCTLFQNEDVLKNNVPSAVVKNTFLMNEDFKLKYNSKLTYFGGLHVYGNESRAPHKIPDVFFEGAEYEFLRCFSLQHTGIKSLPSSLSTLKKLNTLMLRDCTSLEDVNQIRAVRLDYLDLSGASSLKELPDDFFQNMAFLRHLNLSHTQLKKMPSSFYKRTMIQYLSLQGCSRLQLFLERFSYFSLNDLKYLLLSGCQIQTMPHPDVFPKIQVLDLSNATAFKEFQGKFAKTYEHFRKVDLSGTKVVGVQFLSRCVHLHELLLINCSKIETVPCLSREVEILDLSGSISFRKFEDESLGDKLLCVDLSRTQIEKLPLFAIDSRLSQLLLRECAHLEELPPSEFQKLEVLNLSGSINFKIFNDVSSVKLRHLRTLDLSATQISELPHLSECSHLQQLVLKNCPRLEMLPPLKELTKLEVLDLSGSSAFRKFQETDLEKMVKLQDLNLSGTQVVSIPSLDECHDLQTLILRGCLKLESLPNLEALSRLQVLDLSGSVSFTTFQDQSFGSKYHLHILELSDTQVAELPLLSGCSNLCQLLLRNCSKLKNLPPLAKHTRLELLDLSGITNLDMSILSECSNLDAVPFGCMQSLEKVDISGTSIRKLPSQFSGYENLNHLLLKECSNLKMLPQPDSFNNLEVLDVSCRQIEESSSGISVSIHLRFLVTSDNNFLWEFDYGKYFEKFHFILCSLKYWGKEKDNYLRRQEAVFRDIYYQTNHIPWLAEEVPTKFFKICGFQTFPSGTEKVLVHSELLYVENNDFMTRLSDLGAKHVNVMKECWIESCQNIESCFYGEEEEENDALGKCLQNLSVSKLPHLKCLFRDVVNSKSFTCLKYLYIECCPYLVTLFSAHLELKHLDTLKIKFCDRLEHVSGDMLLTEQTFPRLKTLSLWKLPKLHRVCTGALPLLEYLVVKRCPKLEKLPFSLNSTSGTLKIKGEKLWWDNLKCEDDTIKFHISFTEFQQFL